METLLDQKTFGGKGEIVKNAQDDVNIPPKMATLDSSHAAARRDGQMRMKIFLRYIQNRMSHNTSN
jgi:hypothetical protein